MRIKIRCECYLWRLTVAQREFCGTVLTFLKLLKIDSENYSRKWSGRRESNPYYQLGNLDLRSFVFNGYKIALEKMRMHATHTAQAVPELHVVAGRLRDGVPVRMEQSTGSSDWLVSLQKWDELNRNGLAGTTRCPPQISTDFCACSAIFD